jgi:hypothetical protein
MITTSGNELFDAMATQKATVYFTCQPEVKPSLQAWADEEGRSLSNLVERIVLAALEEKQRKATLKPSKGE